jgi:outer membrane protein OmpA-like peptidoglycan-associated protein
MRIRIVAALLIGCMTRLEAQELHVKVSGGWSGLNYNSNQIDEALGFGGGLGVGYTYFLNSNWGIVTGLDLQYSSNRLGIQDQTLANYEVDSRTSAFEYRVSANGYKEKQDFVSLAIPVFLQYRTAFSPKTTGYINLGGKLLLPGKQNIDANANILALSGYYPDSNLEIDDLPNHGFGTLTNWSDETKISLKTAVLLSFETGLAFKIKEQTLYTGLYFDYGLNNMLSKDASENIVTYAPQGIDLIQANSISTNSDLIDKARYVSAGVQLKWGFSLRKNNKQIVIEETSVEETVVDERPIVTESPKKENTLPAVVVSNTQTLTVEEQSVIESPIVFKDINNAKPTLEVTQKLDAIIAILNEKPSVKLKVIGHTCNLGSKSLNQKIGRERAESVADYLNSKGVARDRMIVDSKGELEPLYSNNSSENRAKNRRVALEIVQ